MSKQWNSSFTVGSKSFTAVAINVASKAGEWIRSKMGDIKQLDYKSSSQDLVTEIDKGSETLIRNLLRTHFPNHSILGEEGVEPGATASSKALQEVVDDDYVWIVDPIDGTTNYVHGFPFYSVSIALAHKGEVIVGVIYDPSQDEMFVAEKGKGAYVGGVKMTVSADKNLANSLIATGFPADQEHAFAINMQGLNAIAPKVRNVRIAGSAALHLAYVAAGRLSGFWEIGLNAWDLAAGALLVQEAGGRATDLAGEPYELAVRDMLATNGHIHVEMQEALRIS